MCPALEGGQYKLVGALSGGIECGAPQIPDIYKSYLHATYDWIRDTIHGKFPPVSRDGKKKETSADK